MKFRVSQTHANSKWQVREFTDEKQTRLKNNG